MTTKRKAALFLTSAALLTLLTGAVAIQSGWYDVSATSPHSPAVEGVLRHTMEQSVRHHASDVEMPPDISLRDPALGERAAGHYDVVCADCHGAPGRPQASWMVLYPPPADLTQADVVDGWSDRELFWIIKHGIGDTGMTAMAPGHGDEDVWAVAAFVRQLPTMTPARYQELLAELESAPGHGGHGSAHGGHGSDHDQHGSAHGGHGSDHDQHGSDHDQHGSDHDQHGSDHTAEHGTDGQSH